MLGGLSCCQGVVSSGSKREEVSSSQLIPVRSMNGLGTDLCEYGNEMSVSENSGNVFTGWMSLGFTMRTLLL